MAPQKGRPLRNLTGLRFGYLVAEAAELPRREGRPYSWLCRCDCGRVVSASGNNLTRKKFAQTSCGHADCPHWRNNRRPAHNLRAMRLMREKGCTLAEIGAAFGITYSRVSQLLARAEWQRS